LEGLPKRVPKIPADWGRPKEAEEPALPDLEGYMASRRSVGFGAKELHLSAV
jgi:hypothetical protein